MALFAPSSMGQLDKILSTTGGAAQGALAQNTPGAGDVRSTYGQMDRNPAFALPGGGTLDGTGAPLGRYLQQEVPSATLPLYQGETARRLGLAGVETGVGELQTGEESIMNKRRSVIQQLLDQILRNVGVPGLPAGGMSSGLGMLSQILGI